MGKMLDDENIGLARLRQIKEETKNRWESLGLLYGLTGLDNSKNIAELFECCPTQIINEEINKEKI